MKHMFLALFIAVLTFASCSSPTPKTTHYTSYSADGKDSVVNVSYVNQQGQTSNFVLQYMMFRMLFANGGYNNCYNYYRQNPTYFVNQPSTYTSYKRYNPTTTTAEQYNKSVSSSSPSRSSWLSSSSSNSSSYSSPSRSSSGGSSYSSPSRSSSSSSSSYSSPSRSSSGSSYSSSSRSYSSPSRSR